MKKSLCILIFLFLSFGCFSKALAESDYVLPYPSSMPGSKFYKVRLIYDEIMKYWYFGDFAKYEYNLKMSDKYLVEAKTLFEYKQYLLAYSSLKKSDNYFINIYPGLEKARKKRKDITQKQNMLKNASSKHIEVLYFISEITPDNFIWIPEKADSTDLNLKKSIEESIKIRKDL